SRPVYHPHRRTRSCGWSRCSRGSVACSSCHCTPPSPTHRRRPQQLGRQVRRGFAWPVSRSDWMNGWTVSGPEWTFSRPFYTHGAFPLPPKGRCR
ncbi:hypothetical protein PENTCL1PPCAC_27955, partial [Pristionchus entomophagus]